MKYTIIIIIAVIVIGVLIYKSIRKESDKVSTIDVTDNILSSSNIVKIINKKLDNNDVINEIQIQYEAFKLGISPEIFDIFECDNKTYIVMNSLDKTFFNYFLEYIPTVKKEMKIEDYLNLFEEISTKIKDKVKILNKNGIRHSDLHGNNIMFELDKNDNIKDIKIIDFSRSSKKENSEDIFTFYLEIIPHLYKNILLSTLINKFDTAEQYEEWKNRNENLIIGYIEELMKRKPETQAFGNSLFIENDKPYPYNKWNVNCGENICSLFSIINSIYPTYISTEEGKKFFTFVLNLLGVNLSDITVEDIIKNIPENNLDNSVPSRYFNKKFYRQQYDEFINKMQNNEDEYFGYVNDCKTKVIRRKLIDKPLITNCDWTNIDKEALGKGVDGEVWLVKCIKN